MQKLLPIILTLIIAGIAGIAQAQHPNDTTDMTHQLITLLAGEDDAIIKGAIIYMLWKIAPILKEWQADNHRKTLAFERIADNLTRNQPPKNG